MYARTIWYDEAVQNPTSYLIDGASHTIVTDFGTVIQAGTPQDETHFNNMESGIFDAHSAALLMLNFMRQARWDLDDLTDLVDEALEIESGSVTLTNSQKYPFNNSAKSVPLAHVRSSGNYRVVTEVTAFEGNVGEVVVSAQLTNGFTLAFTGSASSVTISYKVIGGA